MMNPFRIVWELIEFGIQAIFVYILALIIVIGFLAYTIINLKKDEPIIIYKERAMDSASYVDNTVIPKDIIKVEERECIRPAGCRVLEDGTIEYQRIMDKLLKKILDEIWMFLYVHLYASPIALVSFGFVALMIAIFWVIMPVM